MDKTLEQIGLETGTDKVSYHAYAPFYEGIFRELRNQPITLVEIGVLLGSSIKMWEEYLPNARIIGIDCYLAHVKFKYGPRVKLYEINQADGIGLARLFDDQTIDVVIDDGSHMIWDQVCSAAALMPKLKKTGIHLVEDIAQKDESFRILSALRFGKVEVHDFRREKGRYDDVIISMREPGL